MKKTFFFVIIFFLFLSFAVYAQDKGKGILFKSSWVVGSEISHIKYKEPGVMREKGEMYGVAGSYAYHNKIMLKVEGRWSSGKVDYRNSGAIDNIRDYIVEFRGLGGYDLLLLEKFILTPYIGFGYRYLNDDTSEKVSSTGAVGYERESNYFYSPVGIETTTNLKNDWSIGATGEYDVFLWGKQRSHLRDVDPGYNNPINRQKKGYGARGSVVLQKKGEKMDLVIEPFIRYWSIKSSEDANWTYYGIIIGTVNEPENNSTEVGCKLAVHF